MANVRFNEKTYYIPTDKFLITINKHTDVHRDSSTHSKVKSSVEVEQVFAVSAEVNEMYRIKPGWINKEAGYVLKATKNDIKSLTEAFVVKIISNTVVYTEPSLHSHSATVLRVGDLEKVIGESDVFYQLEHGGYIEKCNCRRY